MWRTGVGIFTPDTDMASDAGMEVLNGPRDLAAVRAAIRQAGYNGEKTVLISPSEPPFRKAMADVAGPMMVSGRIVLALDRTVDNHRQQPLLLLFRAHRRVFRVACTRTRPRALRPQVEQIRALLQQPQAMLHSRPGIAVKPSV